MTTQSDLDLIAAFRKWHNEEHATMPVPVPPPAPVPPGKLGVLVPLYRDPGSGTPPMWDTLIAAAKKHPTVSISAILNNDDGVGPSKDQQYVDNIPKLIAAGIRLIGYLESDYGSRPAQAVKAEIDLWRLWYPQVTGIFFDEMHNVQGYETYYKSLSDYAHSAGMSWTVGNPGTSTIESYANTMDTIFVAESNSYPELSKVSGWHTKYPVSRWGLFGYGVPFDRAKILAYRNYVGWVYFTNDNLPNPWDSLGTYFDELLTALETL